MMKKVILCPNPSRDIGFELTSHVYGMLTGLGVHCAVCLMSDMPLAAGSCPLPVSDIQSEISGADMLVSFGGDGTILHTARAAACCGTPILGVNLGKKGFMADLEKEDIRFIEKVVLGDFHIDRRMMLNVAVERAGRNIYSDYALNDVVVSGVAHMIDITVFGDGQRMTSFAGDGIVIATPTGSTAYSMSAGGPIVEPAAENIIITPVCAHVLIAKSFVLAPDRAVTVEMGRLGRKSAYLTADGNAAVTLQTGDIVAVSRSQYVTNLIKVSDRSFYKIVSEKLGEKL